jgi:hypothetical protein
LHEEALVHHPSGHPIHSVSEIRSHLSGRAIDLDKAIEMHDEALHIDRTLGDLDLPASLNAYALLSRFKQSGGLLDLNRAIAGCKEASGSCPPGHSDRSVYLLLLADPISASGKREDTVIPRQ